ncbi:class I adenylate-forming enzyme family protein [Mycoavidus sp. B2-EB]|uniref:class I adenylate-forming enzyme family protein n=1 Tax=Mycoavidus sp. B2-EB TaxID=2651972 RepID=UPI001626964F|nr:class I adenylate-forming enzyme family protein [Mycoavidus sp. B2-EB]
MYNTPNQTIDAASRDFADLQSLPTLLASLPKRIDELPARIAQHQPAALALIENNRHLSYADLRDAIDAMAQQLRLMGVQENDRIMIINENCIALIVLMLALTRLNAWPLPVNARLTRVEIDRIRAHANPLLSIYTLDASPAAQQHAKHDHAHPLAYVAFNLGALAFAKASTSPRSLGNPLMRHDAPSEAQNPATDTCQQCAALLYTTGTTGAPKGVMLSHRNLLFIAAVSSTLRRVTANDVVYAVLPISHVYGLASVCLGTLFAGASLRLAPRFSPESVCAALAHESITILQGVPAMHAKLIEYAQAHPERWHAPQLRFVYSGGAPLDLALKRRAEAFYGMSLHNGYGMTESSPTIAQTRLDLAPTDTSVGPPIPGIQVRIVGPDGAHLKPGKVGELWIQGPNVMLGYYRDSLATQSTIANGWLKTGDLARQDENHALHIMGRCTELIIRAGFNVYPAEIEQVLNSHPDVMHSAVVGRSSSSDEEIIAFIELKPGLHATPQTFASWCVTRLAPYKQPAEIHLLKALPTAPTGKILKRALQQLVTDGN